MKTWLTTLTTILALAEFPVFAQYAYPVPGYTDPEQLAITAKRRRLEQDEQNITIRQKTQHEYELQAQKIMRNLEAVSSMNTEDVPVHVKEYLSEKHQEIYVLERQIETIKKSVANDRQILEEYTRQLDVEEQEYKKRLLAENRHSSSSPNDEYKDKIT